MNARTLAIGMFSLVGTFVLASAVPVGAATFTVNSTLDEPDFAPGDGACLTNNFLCTLRAAVQQANASPGPDTIILPAGTYTLTLVGVPDPIDGVDPEYGDLDITTDITINGAGATTTIIEAGTSLATSVGRVFDLTLPLGGVVAISGVTIRHGDAGSIVEFGFDCGGGGIANRNVNAGAGELNLTDSIVTNNTAGGGGGLCNDEPGTMKLMGTSVTDNIALDQLFGGSKGGGISAGGSLIIIDSTLSGNHADDAGGIWHHGQLEMINSTMSGNSATDAGGALLSYSTGSADLSNTTITANTAGSMFGGVATTPNGSSPTIVVRNTLIAGNSAPSRPDCQGLTSHGFNLIGIGTSADPFFSPCFEGLNPFDQVGSDVSPIDARLGLLAYNGGPTRTHALLAGSPAIDTGNPFSGCTDKFNAPIVFDQRGLNRHANTFCDIGAYEAQQALGGSVASVQASTGVGLVTFATDAGVFGSLDAVSEADLPTVGKPAVPFPFGFFSWTVTGLAAGDTITVTITYPGPVAAPADYWKVLGGVWTNLASLPGVLGDGIPGDNILTLTITDGVFPDADGLANGQISDPGGVAGSLGPEIVPFADFAATFKPKHHKADLTAVFTLGAASNGIAPLSEEVTLTIGAFSATIPAGSFHVDKKGRFEFEGVNGGVEMQIVIAPLGGGGFALKAELRGVNLMGGNPVPVTLTIGNDSGSTAAQVKKND